MGGSKLLDCEKLASKLLVLWASQEGFGQMFFLEGWLFTVVK